MREQAKWLGGILLGLALFGFAALFVGVVATNLDSSMVTTFPGLDSSVYSASTEFITIGGIFIVAMYFAFLAYSMKDILLALWESL